MQFCIMQELHSCPLHLLDQECLRLICSLIDPVTLAKFSCTCREFQEVSYQNCLWERVSQHRWFRLNEDFYARAEALQEPKEARQGETCASNAVSRKQLRKPSVDFKTLYASNNAWTLPKLRETHRNELDPYDSHAFCVSRAPADNFCSAAGDAVYTVQTTVQLWSTGDSSHAGRTLIATNSCHRSNYGTPNRVISITELSAGFVATGGSHGEICLHNLRPDATTSTRSCTTWHGGERNMVEDMQYCPSQDALYALQARRGHNDRTYLQKWDADSGRLVAEAHEFVEHWDLACFCVADQDCGGHEVVAGAVWEPCGRCEEYRLHPSLCAHKPTLKGATICMFDTRAGVEMVQRYSIHHRSLYPAMACARGHFLFTSHVGSPLTVWDNRQMSHVLYEEDHLPKPDQLTAPDLPLPLAGTVADHQGLHLTTDGDNLVGRAENGMIWLWDLSSCLGWQKGGPMGSWAQGTQAVHDRSGTEYQAGFAQRCPKMLGCVPCEEGSAKIDLQNGRTCPLIAVSTYYDPSLELPLDLDDIDASIVCLSLAATL
ncbi:hypothetical protein ABBQ32_010710 [Trebouxia sp. C0010 RCD-2024]